MASEDVLLQLFGRSTAVRNLKVKGAEPIVPNHQSWSGPRRRPIPNSLGTA